MGSDILASTLKRAEKRNLSVVELARTIEIIRATDGLAAVKALYQAWLKHNRDNPLIYAVRFNYGVFLMDNGDLAGAAEQLEDSVESHPDFMPSYINLGRVYERQGAADKAVRQWSAAVDKMAPVNGSAISHKTIALNQMARVLESNNQDEAAEMMLRQSIEIDREQPEVVQHYIALRQRECKWPIVSPWDRVERHTLMAGISPLSISVYTDDPMMQLATNWNYNRRDVGIPVSGVVTSHWAAKERAPSEPLRIGYLSSDLREHAIGYLMAEVFGLHDRKIVEVYAYYCGIPAEKGHQERLKASVDHWVDISRMDDAAAARRIADDGIQILVDVNGYTRDGRTKLLALRPAPVIVNWLGFPGSMASPYHHYIIADDWIIPPESEIYYSEKVARLPCYQPNDRKRIVAPETPSRQEAGLPDDAMVYCSFNGTHKITQFTLDRWLTILERVPGSVLWLLDSTETARNGVQQYAGRKGIAPDRIIFAEKKANAHHLARYPLADLFLDTSPYGAHTTASDALWMGVPMLTWSGRSFASRVCGSLLKSAGMPELICDSPEEYVDRAVALGRNKAMLQSYRERLLAGRDTSILFDTPLLVGELEKLYQGMWADLKDGRLPRPDLHNLDIYHEIGCHQDYEQEEIQAVRDYPAWWREKLLNRHIYRPIPADRRLWTEAEIDAADS